MKRMLTRSQRHPFLYAMALVALVVGLFGTARTAHAQADARPAAAGGLSHRIPQPQVGGGGRIRIPEQETGPLELQQKGEGYVGEFTTANDGPEPNSFDAYTDADAYLRYRIAKGAILSLRLQNAGDERYAPIYGYPAPGRTFFVELATR